MWQWSYVKSSNHFSSVTIYKLSVLDRLLCFVDWFILVSTNCPFRLFVKSVPINFIWHHRPRTDVGKVSLIFNCCNISEYSSSARFALRSRVIELWTRISHHNSFFRPLYPPPPGTPFCCQEVLIKLAALSNAELKKVKSIGQYIVLLAPSANAMRSMLHTCDLYATQYNVLFNAIINPSASAVILSVCPSLLCARSAILRSL